MNLLIIGGTGVLSSAVTNEALKQGMSVTMINRGRRKLPEGVEVIISDMTKYDYIDSQLQGKFFDAVIDFLCYSDKQTTLSFKLYSKYTKQYFFISSCAVYNTTVGGVMCEDGPKELPIWNYSVEKWTSEQHLQQMARETDCKYTIIRPCVTYGDTRIPYGVSPLYGYHWTLCARILAGKPIIRWNEGVNRCNMTRVEDFAVGVVGLVGNSKAYNEAFNVCGEETPSYNDVLNALAELLHKEVKTIDITSEYYAKELPSRAGEILGGRSIDTLNSNSKIKDAVPAFKQTIGLKDGIAQTLNAYKNQNYQYGIDWHFDADTDRIISKWCKKKGISTDGMNLRFIDYLGNATANDKRTYWLEYNKKNLAVKFVTKSINVLRRIKSKIKRLFK